MAVTEAARSSEFRQLVVFENVKAWQFIAGPSVHGAVARASGFDPTEEISRATDTFSDLHLYKLFGCPSCKPHLVLDA